MIAPIRKFIKPDGGYKSYVGVGQTNDRTRFKDLISNAGHFIEEDDLIEGSSESYRIYDTSTNQLEIAFLFDEEHTRLDFNSGLVIIGNSITNVQRSLDDYESRTGIKLTAPGENLRRSLELDGGIIHWGYQ